MFKQLGWLMGCAPLLVNATVWAQSAVDDIETNDSVSPYTLRAERDGEAPWGIAAVIRGASIPYATKSVVEDSTVSTFVPMMFYQGDRFFLNGTEGGMCLFRKDKWELNALVRMHFIDIPSSFQNQIGGDTADLGFQLKYKWDDEYYSKFDLLNDPEGRFKAQASLGADVTIDNWRILPEVSAIFKGDRYNSYYYGLGLEPIDAGMDIKAGVGASYHVASHLYLLGGGFVRYFDGNVRDSQIVTDDWQGELFLGFGFFNDRSKPKKSSISTRPYLRLAHGWATPSNIGDIFGGNMEDDPYNNQLTSVFYGHPLTDELFGIPLDIYLTPGFVWHWESEVQSSIQEYVIAIKAYYTFEWPVKWRFGVAEGLSYVSGITHIEQAEMDEKGYEPSQLLNYLDFSVDVNVGDLINQNSLDNLWVGYSLHHRSAIFESASQFGRIKGGSNYNTFYIQYDF
ncbi:MipA/OmpV family protein [Photobacterium aphoticum]|uniref:MipA/OmpV family protein n=1 Tax=Photobacterium aphoticum TaxID=754436 RepID=UPI0019905BDF|nr:MltA-interacting MipA family protein [Photobacterium aphoticum]